MKYKFKAGDGVTHLTTTVTEREEITKLLKDNGYPLYGDYKDRSREYYGVNSFQNNFRFRKDGKWVTSSREQVTNPLTFEQIKNLVIGNGEPQYEIY